MKNQNNRISVHKCKKVLLYVNVERSDLYFLFYFILKIQLNAIYNMNRTNVVRMIHIIRQNMMIKSTTLTQKKSLSKG